MKFVITALVLLLAAVSYSQSALTGKWKPIFFSIDTIARGDVRADTLFITNAFKENFKDDEDPEMSEEILRFFIEKVFKLMKETEEEYLINGKFINTNIRTGVKKTGSYNFNTTGNIVERAYDMSDRKESFIVSWINDQLVLTSEVQGDSGKKRKLQIVFQKL